MELTYEQAIEKAASLRDIGQTEVYLCNGPYPWHLVTSCEPGGSHRLDISTNTWFYAHDPNSGLMFRWSFDLEPRSASGSSSYHIDMDGIREVLAKLRDVARAQFQEYLANCAVKVREKGREWQKIADRQLATADALDSTLKDGEE